MSKVLDYTREISPAALKLADVIGVCRYLSWLPNPKVITIDEYRRLTGAGIRVILNWEYRAVDWMTGATAGDIHGKEAVRQAKALGYPAGQEIIGSADFDMTAKQWDGPCKAYAKAFASAISAGGYRPGVYGPWDVLQWASDAGYMNVFWQAGMSWAWSGGRNGNDWPGAHLIQRGHMTVGGVDTDWNDIKIQPLFGRQEDSHMMYLIDILISGTAPEQVNKTGLLYDDGSFHHIAKMEALNWVIANVAPKNLGTMWDWEAVDRFGINLEPKQGTTVNVDVTQDMLNTAIGTNADKFGTSVASHIKIV